MKQSNKVAVLVFVVSFFVRIVCINYTPQSNSFSDISCLVNGGQMISHGINPYDFDENTGLRQALREDDTAYNAWLCSTQELWNYHSANNLPFNLIFNGFLDYFFDGNVYYFRYAYAFLDSCIGFLTALFFFQLLRLPLTWVSTLFVALVGGLSPSLLLNGTLIPEDKGFQILLILLALWFSISRRFFLACLFLSFSIGFKAIGAVVAPICLLYYVLSLDGFQKIEDWKRVVAELFSRPVNLKKTVLYTLVTLGLFLAIYLPYASDFSRIMSQRLLYDIDNNPNHASLWLIFFNLFPEDWQTIRTVALSVTSVVLVALFLSNLIPVDIFLISLLVLFLCGALVTGSLDRTNMAMQPAILFMALRWRKESMLLGWYYAVGGALMFLPVAYKHFIDDTIEYAFFSSLFVLGYCLVFYFIVCRKAYQLLIVRRSRVA